MHAPVKDFLLFSTQGVFHVLKQLKWVLSKVGMRSDLIETFKIVNRKYDINPELFFS